MKKFFYSLIVLCVFTLLVPSVQDQVEASVDQRVKNHESSQYSGWEYLYECWYYYEDGQRYTGWLFNNDEWYYLDSDGIMKTGWLLTSGGIYSGTYYFFSKSGVMQTGWEKVRDEWYHLNSKGIMDRGWVKVADEWYYLDFYTGEMASDEWLLYNNNDWYYAKSNGEMGTGWAEINDKWYYFNDSGVMQTGWLKTDGKWYYLTSSGSMKTGWVKSNGTWYYLTESGEMAIDSVIDGDYVNSTGEWVEPNDIENIIGTVTDQYGVQSISKEAYTVSLYKNGVEIGTASSSMFSAPPEFRDMLVDMTLAYKPSDYTTKDDLNQMIDETLHSGEEVFFDDDFSKGIVVYHSRGDALKIIFGGYDNL
jgi:glucan-binding YG repeat protein